MTPADTLRNHLEQIIGPRHRIPSDAAAAQKIEEVENYLCDCLSRYGWEVSRQNVQYRSFTNIWNHHFNDLDGYNIIAKKPGRSDKVLIVAAHHDTVANSPGADDNGTGVALLLYLAEVLAEVDLEPTILLISFDFEELGLIGSSYFVEHIEEIVDSELLDGVMVLEMLGYYTEKEQGLPPGFDKLYWNRIRKLKSGGILLGNFYTVVYNGNSKHVAAQLNRHAQLPQANIRDPVDIPLLGPVIKKLVPSVATMLRSDHTPFWLQQLPAVMVTDTADFRNPNYHTTRDTISTIDFDQLALVAKGLEAAICNWST